MRAPLWNAAGTLAELRTLPRPRAYAIEVRRLARAIDPPILLAPGEPLRPVEDVLAGMTEAEIEAHLACPCCTDDEPAEGAS